MTNAAGAIVWKADYDPFGKASVRVYTIENNLRLPGQYYDRETGLHYNYFRDYDPGSGRYIEADPIGLAGGSNLYSYGLNNPTRYTDPSGLIVPLVIPGICAAGGCEALIAAAVMMSTSGKSAIKSIAQKIEDMCRPDEKDPCEQQYEADETDCFESYGKVFGYSHFSFQGCMQNAKTRREQCKKGLPQISKWGDGHVTGQPPISPRRN